MGHGVPSCPTNLGRARRLSRSRRRRPHAEPTILLEIDFQTSDAGAELRVVGEVDLATVPELRSALEDAHAAPDPLRLDLRGVSFIDSTGLQELLGLHRRRRDPERPWSLVPSPAVLRVCEVSGVAGRLPLVPAG